jgi:hypothetical protein
MTRILVRSRLLLVLVPLMILGAAPAAPVSGDRSAPAQPKTGVTLRVQPRSLILAPGGTASAIVQIWYREGFTSTDAEVWASGLPRGMTATVAPAPLSHQGMAVLMVGTDRSVPPDVYEIRLAVDADGIRRARIVDVTVTTDPGFSLTVRPAEQIVPSGIGMYRVSLESINGFADPVRLHVDGLPPGVAASIEPDTLSSDGDAILRVMPGRSVTPGRYELTISDGSGVHIARTVLVVGGGGSSWRVREVGSAGAPINTVLVGPGRDDGVSRVYAGTVTTGRILEFSWDGNSWADPVDIGGSRGGAEIHNMGMGPGRDDGTIRIYACSRDGNLYELTYTDPDWDTETVGRDNGGDCTHAVVGDGRNDGTNRLYASRGDEVWEYTWRQGSRWRGVRVGRVSQGIAHGLALGAGRGGHRTHLYVASTASGSWEATYEHGDWRMHRMGDTGDVRNISFGTGRNDGVVRVYAGTLDEIREFTWRRGDWRQRSIDTTTGIIHVYVLAGRNDGVDRLYGAGGNGHAYEFRWTGRRWASRDLGGASEYLYGFHFGRRPGDSAIRLYGGSFDGSAYEFAWG